MRGITFLPADRNCHGRLVGATRAEYADRSVVPRRVDRAAGKKLGPRITLLWWSKLPRNPVVLIEMEKRSDSLFLN